MKRGLVLEGGGAKGAYQVGCLRAFQEHDIKFDAIAGTSIGALNGALLSSGKVDEGTAYWSALSVRRAVKPRWRFIPVFPLILLYTASYYHNHHDTQAGFVGTPTGRSIGTALSLNLVVCGVAAIQGGVAFAGFLAAGWFFLMWLPWLAYYAFRRMRFSVLTPSPLASFLEEIVTSTDTLKIPLYVTVTDHANGFDPDHPKLYLGKNFDDRPVQKAIEGAYAYPNYLKINGMTLSMQRDLLLASAALPLGIFPAIHVDSKEYVDGGMADNLPIFPLMTLEQCSEVVVVALRPTQEDSLLTRWQDIDRSLRRRALSVEQATELYYWELYRRGGDLYEAKYEAPHYEPPVILPLRSPESWPEQTVLIAPKRSLGTFLTGTMHFRARYAKRLLQQGYEDAIAAISTHQIGSAAQQEVFGSGQARQASQVSGVQYNYFGDAGPQAEPGVSIAAPVGQLDERLPLRGRATLLAALTDTTADLRVRVVHGLGGCGKTRLALEVASQLQERGAEVWWVSAADQSRLVAGMRTVARRVGLTDAELQYGDSADLLWQRLAGRQQEWLLVIDNADDPQLLAGPDGSVGDGTGWLRPLRSAAGIVLVTSRDGQASSWGPWCDLHRVAVLAPGEAAQILLDHAGGHQELGSAEEAEALARRLGRLPLALKIAGSFLAESMAVPVALAAQSLARTYSQYLAAVESGQFEMVFPAPSAGELTPEQARQVIGRTRDLTLDLLTARQMPEARRVLRLLACLADAPIPYELVLNPGTLRDSPLLEGINGPRLWQILKTLAGFGLIDLISGDADKLAVIRLHPLVRDTSHPGAGDLDEREAYLTLATQLLRRATQQAGKPEDPAIWPIWQALTPHVIYTFDVAAASSDCPNETAIAASDAAALAVRYQSAQGLYSQAEEVERKIVTLRLRVLGADNLSTLAARHALAYEMAERGDHAGAEAEYRDILAVSLRVLGAHHPDTLDTRHELAYEMAERRDHAGAEAEYRDILTAKLRVLGADHPDTLAARHALAYLMAERGDHAGAEAEYRDVLTAKLRVLGADHAHTLTTRHGLAREMAARGDHAGAEAEYRDVLTARLRVQGADHPDTLAARHGLAGEMAARGDHAGAEAEYRDVLTARLRVLGADHPDTLTTRHGLAREMAARGDHAGAEAE